MMQTNIVVFEDDELIRKCWDITREQEGLKNFHCFRSWEDFQARGNDDIVKGATAFIDFDYQRADSEYNGIDIATALIERGIGKLFSVSGMPEAFAKIKHLFTAILNTKVPDNVLDLIETSTPLPNDLRQLAIAKEKESTLDAQPNTDHRIGVTLWEKIRRVFLWF